MTCTRLQTMKKFRLQRVMCFPASPSWPTNSYETLHCFQLTFVLTVKTWNSKANYIHAKQREDTKKRKGSCNYNYVEHAALKEVSKE